LEQKNIKQSSLKQEAAVYKILGRITGFPEFFWYGVEGDYNVLIIELLGHNLESLLQLCKGKFTLATTFTLAEQMVSLLKNKNS